MDTRGEPAGRPLRADARRNRERVLQAAVEAFAAEGLAVPVHEIARRAGVGTGTVSRHFPTKESLVEAIVRERVERVVERARALAAEHDAATAFSRFVAVVVAESAANRGLADAFVGTGYDLRAVRSRAEDDVHGALHDLLAAAQRAGAVRADIDVADVKALIAGCMARERDTPDPGARDRLLAVVSEGLRAHPGGDGTEG